MRSVACFAAAHATRHPQPAKSLQLRPLMLPPLPPTWQLLDGTLAPRKSEVMVHLAYRAAQKGAKVLVLCPTGTLVHAYRERIPEHTNITIDTLHSGLAFKRDYDKIVEYCPPSKLRKYDLILLDEASQIDQSSQDKLRMALSELPQKPVVCVAADWRQLNPVNSTTKSMQDWCSTMAKHKLTESYRTNDSTLLTFLKTIRTSQPSRTVIQEFFNGRRLGRDLVPSSS